MIFLLCGIAGSFSFLLLLFFWIPFHKPLKIGVIIIQIIFIIIYLIFFSDINPNPINNYVDYSEDFDSAIKIPIFPIKDFDFAMENEKKPIIILQRLENITYQNFKDNEYTKECLKNYFIKSDEECPITDIIIQKEKNNTPVGYHEKIFKNIYFYYTNNKLDG